MSELTNFIALMGGQIAKQPLQAQLRWATCESVDWEARTMTARGQSDGLEYFDVLLGLQAIAIKPKKDALCLLGVLEGQDAATFLITASEIEEVVLLSTGGNVQISNGTVSLYSLMGDLMQIITNLKVHTPAGPSTGLLPESLLALNAFETNFKSLLKHG